MLAKNITRFLFSSTPKQVIPPPPRLLSGELQPFKFSFENQQLYDGYSMDQLYGSKVGVKFPPAIRAQMMKDNIAVGLIFFVGIGLIVYYNSLFHTELRAIDKVQATKLSKVVELPPRTPGDLL